MIEFEHEGKPAKLGKILGEGYGIGYSAFCMLLRKKEIKVNGARIKEDILLAAGDKVSVFYCKENRIVLETVFEDGNILIIDKPAGIESAGKGSAEEVLRLRGENVSAAHRLDRNTSGLLIFAKCEAALAALTSASKKGVIRKVYRAEVFGRLPAKEGILQGYLVKDSVNSFVKIYDNQTAGAYPITTAYKVLSEGAETSVIETEIERGKTHQIRAHLAHIGNFIVGDGKYGDNAFNRKAGKKRQELRAVGIVFGRMPAPLEYLSGKEICF